jgi:hypothetical protein
MLGQLDFDLLGICIQLDNFEGVDLAFGQGFDTKC